MSNIVTRVRYKKGNNFQQLVGGWCKYVAKENGADGKTLRDLSSVNDQYLKEFGIFDDTIESEENYIWNKNGDVDKKDILKTIPNDKTGRIWTLVVSFPPEFAEQNNLITKQDYYLMTKSIMPRFILDNNLDLTNVEWYASLHRDTDNPHLHICFFEKEITRSKETLEKLSLKYLKSNIASFLIDNTSYYKDQDYLFLGLEHSVRKSNYTKVDKGLFYTDKFRKSLNKDLLDLYSKLPKRGRLQYNSNHLNFCRKDIDKIIEKILYHDTIKYNFEKYYHSLEEIQRKQIKMYGNSKNNNYIDNKMKRLYSKIGNDILYNFKAYNSKQFLDYQKEFLEVNIMNMDFKSRNFKKKSSVIKAASSIYKLGKLANLSDSDIKKVLNKWIKKSNIKYDVDLLFDVADKGKEDLSATDFYKALSSLGYNKERYDHLKSKSFYKNLRFKQFINKANKFLMLESKKEEKILLELLEKEMEEKKF